MSTIVVVGSSMCGKSAVVRAYVCADRGAAAAEVNSVATILDEYRLPRAGLTIVDTGGMDIYWALMSEQFARADMVLFVCDITRRETVAALTGYLSQLRLAKCGEATTPVVVCANKTDLARSRFATTEAGRRDEITRLAGGFPVRYVEVSARSGDNIDALFAACEASLPVRSASVPPPALGSARSDGSTPRSVSSSAASSPRAAPGCATM